MKLSKIILVVFFLSIFYGSSLMCQSGNNREKDISKVLRSEVELIEYSNTAFIDTIHLEDLQAGCLFVLIDINVCSICRDKLLDYLVSSNYKAKKVILLFSGYLKAPRHLKYINTHNYASYVIKSIDEDLYNYSDPILFTVSKTNNSVGEYFTYNKNNDTLKSFLNSIQ